MRTPPSIVSSTPLNATFQIAKKSALKAGVAVKAVLLVSFLLLANAVTGNAQVLINGNFEAGGPGANSFAVNITPTAWLSSSPNEYTVNGTAFGVLAQSGSNFVALQSVSGAFANIYSTMTGLTIGATYQLSFYAHGGSNFGYQASTAWYASVSNLDNSNFVTVTQGDNTSDVAWEFHTASFTATAASQYLYFNVMATVSGAGTYLDNVSVSAVPEPSSVVLLGVAGFAVLIFKRRRTC